MKIRFVGAVAMAAGLAAAPLAAHATYMVGKVQFPDTYPVAGKNLQINGGGVRVFFHIVDGYATALYMVQPVHQEQAIIDAPNPKVIYTEFLHAAPVSQVRTEYNQIHQAYCAAYPCNPTDEASYKEFISHILPSKVGGTQAIIITDTGVTVLHDNQQVVQINNPSFGKDLIRSLVGSPSPTAEYRNGIIGKAS